MGMADVYGNKMQDMSHPWPKLSGPTVRLNGFEVTLDALVDERNEVVEYFKKKCSSLDRELDEARKRITELEAPPVINKVTGLPTGEHTPIRVPFSDAQIERMAEAFWKRYMTSRASSADAIRAALAAGGLEPCTVPTGHVLRDRLVDAEAKIERQRKNLRQLYEARERDARLIAELRAEVDEDNAAAASVNDLLVQVQNLTAERDAQEIELADLRFYQREFAAVSAERDTLAERASVPMKVRWDVSDERLQTAVELGTFIRLDLDKIAHLRDVFAAHAVIDAPAGVPSVEELMAVGDKAYNACHGPYQEGQEARATAIRDAVLAG